MPAYSINPYLSPYGQGPQYDQIAGLRQQRSPAYNYAANQFVPKTGYSMPQSYPYTANPPSYQTNSAINDPTLAAGAVGTGGGGYGPAVPPGSIPINQFTGNANIRYAQGWRKRMGPDGQMYWVPPAVPGTAPPPIYHINF